MDVYLKTGVCVPFGVGQTACEVSRFELHTASFQLSVRCKHWLDQVSAKKGLT